jgi:glutamate 5-kinase
MNRKDMVGNSDRIVIKVGTTSILMGKETASSEFMDGIAAQVKKLKDAGKEILLVTSGAIGIGMKAMHGKPKPNEIPIRQAAASVGQSILMQKWNDSFQKYGIVTAQILITLDDYSDRERVLNLNNTLDVLLDYGAVPIFNENDAICVKEIGAAFGDNDTLSAVIASRIDADLLIILSDIDGLYTGNPKKDPDAVLIRTVSEITPEIRAMAGGSGSSVGTGGMKTKIQAASICGDAGCNMIIASGSETDIICRLVDGEEIGTVFTSDNRISKKRRWLKAAHSVGSIVIDAGALSALENHKSLLPIGVKEVRGQFSKGDVVDIICKETVVAKALPNYNSDEISRIRGIHSDKISAVLGKRPYLDVVLSENIALL